MAAIDKQLLLMEYIVSNSDLYARVSNILNEGGGGGSPFDTTVYIPISVS